jgi:hypothetical protein
LNESIYLLFGDTLLDVDFWFRLHANLQTVATNNFIFPLNILWEQYSGLIFEWTLDCHGSALIHVDFQKLWKNGCYFCSCLLTTLLSITMYTALAHSCPHRFHLIIDSDMILRLLLVWFSKNNDTSSYYHDILCEVIKRLRKVRF